MRPPAEAAVATLWLQKAVLDGHPLGGGLGRRCDQGARGDQKPPAVRQRGLIRIFSLLTAGVGPAKRIRVSKHLR